MNTTTLIAGSRRWRRAQAARAQREGSAMVPALILMSMLTMLGLSMLSAGVSGSKVVTSQSDEHRLTSGVESVAALAAQDVWAGYVRDQGGAAGTLETARTYLDSIGLPHVGGSGAPSAAQGQDWLARLALPTDALGREDFDGVHVDAVRIVRRDEQDATRLYVTVQATTKRGEGLVSNALARAVQLVYTIEPRPFDGFDYGILANNVNCVFCHTTIDSAERYWNTDPAAYDSFHRVKVGTLESLMLRSDARPGVSDWDSDTRIAGTLYVRGHATNHNGAPITNWAGQSTRACIFDAEGDLDQDSGGNLAYGPLTPAGDPPAAGENLYLNYPSDYTQMVDGNLPSHFPPPFPDSGGIDPVSGLPTPAGAGNRQIDPNEFHAQARYAEGVLTAGTITVAGADPIDSDAEYTQAFATGNQSSLGPRTSGNVILHGTRENPIVIDGTVAIDGDVILNGYVQGSGTILASGNVYVPSDLQYLDGRVLLPGDDPLHPTGPRTFGIAQDGTRNVLGLSCGGNVLIGDFLQPGGTPGDPHDIVTGGADGGWNFALGQISLFNRGEWARTHPVLPGPGESLNDPSTWSVPNPGYQADYLPRYYQFGAGDQIPIYNRGGLYFDADSGTWVGDAEVPLAWDPDLMTILDPSDTSEAALYDPATGAPRATVLPLTPEGSWISDTLLERAIEDFRAEHEAGQPLRIDGLMYTNNAIFGLVYRRDSTEGRMEVNGALVCADLGLLAPGKRGTAGTPASELVPGSPYRVGLRVNYDKRTKGMINVTNPFQVTMKRTLWNPTANFL